MRALRVLGLVLVVAAGGLLSGGAAGAAPATAALVATTAGIMAATPPVDAQPPPGPPAPEAAPVPPPPQIVAGTPCLDTARACVDLANNQAWLIRAGVVEFGPVRIAHGAKGYRTPPGTFRVTFKNRHHVSSIYGSRMPYAVFFNRGIAFHVGDLAGRSHGCVRLSRDSAKTFFATLHRGDVVQVV